MKARLMVECPGEIEMTAKLTMKMDQWEQLRDQLESKWPSSRLYSVITEMLTDARRVYYAKPDDD